MILPGLAITLLIAPIALVCGLAGHDDGGARRLHDLDARPGADPPPPVAERARSLRVTRVVVFALGLAAGGAGLAGSLATSR